MSMNYKKIAEEIREGKFENLKSLGLNHKNINKPMISDTPFPIITNGKNQGIKEVFNPTPLVYAILCQKPSIVLHLIIKKGASLDEQFNGRYPIHYAASVSDVEIIYRILQIIGTDNEINRAAGDGSTPLHIAALNKNYQICLLLLQEGADVNVKDSYGRTPLHVAVQSSEIKIVQALISAGANLNIKNSQNQSAVDIAKSQKNNNIFGYLQRIISKTEKPRLLDKVLQDLEIDDDDENMESDQLLIQLQEKLSLLYEEVETTKTSGKLSAYKKNQRMLRIQNDIGKIQSKMEIIMALM